MQISLIKKKYLIVPALIFVLFGIFGLGFREYKQNQQQEYIRQIENQKAEEISIRIIEGWTNKEIGAYLEKQGIVNETDFQKAVKNFNIEDYTQIPTQTKGDLQGFLYPDTYRLFKSITNRTITPSQIAANAVISKLLDTFEKKLPKNAAELANRQGLNLYEAITLASIVENETGRNATTAESKSKLEEERRIVAGIFYNRLRANVALQSDATINYVTNKNDPTPSLSDIDIKSPYNTYKNRGLPPTPIGNPSLSSITAVLNPDDTDYFYFLHKQPSGEPVYSKTFDEHVKNKLKYLK